MQNLNAYLDGLASCALVSLDTENWHRLAQIPAEPGWYFLRTTTPVDVLQRQTLWSQTYVKKRSLAAASVRNYDIAERAKRFSADMASYWNLSEVYSGMASDLLARAREHTFPDPGTAGLALSKYPELHDYEWLFGFITLRRFSQGFSCPEMMLRLGEQVWRSKNGWPLLCIE